MVTRWLARALLSIAARRWPAAIRDELRAEWLAELHALAAPPQRGRMLRFSASLALTRPRLGDPVPLFDQDLTLGRVTRHALLVLAAPVATIPLGVFLPFPFGLLTTTVFVLLAVLAGANSPLLRPWAVVIAVVGPATAALVLTPLVQPQFSGPWLMPAATVLWAAMLAATLLLAGRLLLTSRFRVRTAVAVAGLGGLAAWWIAATVAILPHAAGLGIDTDFALLWYPAQVLWPLDVPVGDLPPDPFVCVDTTGECAQDPPAIDLLLDFTEGYAGALTATTAYAAAYVLGSASTIGPGEAVGTPAVPSRRGVVDPALDRAVDEAEREYRSLRYWEQGR